MMFNLTTIENKIMSLTAIDIIKVHFDNEKESVYVKLNDTWWYDGSYVKESVEEVYRLIMNDKAK